MVVDDDVFVGEDCGEFVGDGEMCGVMFVCEEFGVVEGGGCGVNGGELVIGGGVLFCEWCDVGIGVEVFYVGVVGEKE